jgi:hypothetical protein
MSDCVGIHLAALILRQVEQGDLGAGNDGAGLIKDSSLNAAALRKLRPHIGGEEEQEERDSEGKDASIHGGLSRSDVVKAGF